MSNVGAEGVYSAGFPRARFTLPSAAAPAVINRTVVSLFAAKGPGFRYEGTFVNSTRRAVPFAIAARFSVYCPRVAAAVLVVAVATATPVASYAVTVIPPTPGSVVPSSTPFAL